MNLGEKLRGSHAFITGASGGLGAHFARLCAASGAAVTIGARRRQKLEALVAELQSLGARHARAVDLDVADEASIEAAWAAAHEDEAPPVDVLVNNAGISSAGPAIDTPAAEFDRVMGTNLRGVWLMSGVAARAWRERGEGGVIVNIASILGHRIIGGTAPYVISKAGVVQMTEVLALEWARFGIRVNALCPGYVVTEMNAAYFGGEAGLQMIRRIPMRRIGQPEDLDGAFLLLATDASAWMTGASLAVDGGHLVSPL